jgi:hypothetical protein
MRTTPTPLLLPVKQTTSETLSDVMTPSLRGSEVRPVLVGELVEG